MEEERKARSRAYMAAYRERQRAKGIGWPTLTAEQKAKAAERARIKRAKLKIDGKPTHTWAKNNPDRHLENTRRWRSENPDRAREIARRSKKKRISTPWGAINNCMFPVLHAGVKANSTTVGKYAAAAGYRWADLRAHLEAQFTDGMTWENWGEVWELDHIEPLSAFHYVDLLDPLFKQAWRLDNLRPLLRHLNQSKGSKREPQT